MDDHGEGLATETPMERLQRTAGCCADGCSCGDDKKVRGNRWLGYVVLALAMVLVVRAVGKTGTAVALSPEGTSFVSAAEALTTPREIPAGTPSSGGDLPVLHSLRELDSRAARNHGVFVFLPSGDGDVARTVIAAVRGVAAKVGERGMDVASFALAAGSEDFATIAVQAPPPSVLVIVKGRGGLAVTGDVTEAKLFRALAAASTIGGCGPAGDGSAGCGPADCGPSGCN